MSRSLGRPGDVLPLRHDGDAAPATPAATRVRRSGWRDPRLWIGVLLVTVSVVAGARLLAAADDTVPVWALAGDRGAGSRVVADDLVAVRVRFADADELDRYFVADEPLPADAVLVRSLGEGELLPRAAVGAADSVGLLQVPIEVEPQRVPPGVGTGSVVDVYVADAARRPRAGDDGPALEAVTVVDAPPVADTFAVTGTRQLVLAVPEEDAAAFATLLGRADDPVIRVLQRS